MKLVTYRASVEAEARLGVIVDDLVVDVANLGADYDEDLPDTMLGLIDLGRPALDTLRAMPGRCRRRLRPRHRHGAGQCADCWPRSRGRARTSSASG